MSALGHSLRIYSASWPTDVRFAPKATELLRCRECSDVSWQTSSLPLL
jgi:hypothetical protein